MMKIHDYRHSLVSVMGGFIVLDNFLIIGGVGDVGSIYGGSGSIIGVEGVVELSCKGLLAVKESEEK
jgi:hypothetical protein